MSEQPVDDNVEPSYYLAEGVAGEGDAPEWFMGDKYKSVSEQAKAYPEAQKLVGRLGEFVGAPEGDEGLSGYSTENWLPESVDVELDLENPLLKGMAPVFKEMGLSQKGMDKVAQTFILLQKDAADAAQQEADFQRQQLGAEPQQRIDNIKDFLTAQLDDEEQRQALLDMTVSAKGVEALETLADKIRGGRMATPPPAPSVTKDEIDALQNAVDEHGNRKMRDPAYAKMVRDKRRQLVGDGPA